MLSESVVAGVSRRTDFPLVLSKAAIVVIDVQDYLSSQSEASEVEGETYLYQTSLPRAIANISRLVHAFRKRRDADGMKCGCEVIFTYLQSLTDDCRDVSLDYKLSGPKLSQLPGPSKPARFLSMLQPSTSKGKGDILIPKTSCSVFSSTNIAYVLRNLQCEQVVLVGQLTDQCVESACRDAADLGFFVTVVDNACAANGIEEHAKGLSGMKGFARIATTEQVLGEIEQGEANNVLLPSSEGIVSKGATSIDDEKHQSQGIKTLITPAENWCGYSCSKKSSGVVSALIRSLHAAGVQFVRFASVDAFNSIRCKAIPLNHIRKDRKIFDAGAAIAEVCIAGMPRFADVVIPSSGLSAARVLTLKPDYETLRILPYARKSALVFCTTHDQVTGGLSPLCTRGLLARLVDTARNELGLRFNIGAEIEFCLFKDTDGKVDPIDTSLFAHTTTLNEQEEFISTLCNQLSDQDIAVEMIHAESAAGQLEIVLNYSDDAMRIADNIVLAKETVRACSKSYGMKAVFLPKISEKSAGNGLHVHFSFSDTTIQTENAFPHQDGMSLMSVRAGSFIEGILRHLAGILAITMPSMNSFRRIGEGCWTGYDVRWALEDKEAPLRVCIDPCTGQASNVEFKLFDGSANIYMGLTAILAAGISGISNCMTLRDLQKADGKMPPPPQLPTSFEESLDIFEKDDYLKSIFGKDLATAYVAVRRNEVEHDSEMSLVDEVLEAYANA